MGRDLFHKPFDDGTIDKLQIFDLFAGEGMDVNGVLGSPMLILKVLNEFKESIIKSKVKIRVIINEYEKEKFEILSNNLESIADRSLYTLEYYNEDFIDVFNRFFDSMRQTANFLFLDQNGIKQITEEVFGKLTSLRQTDFLFFISSSYIKRFGEVEEFQKYLKITKQDLEGKSYYHIHRAVLNYYRSKIPEMKKYFLAPFSIKKPSGIYGLVFGTNHTLGIEKFLNVCWKHDKLTGEANFDIDNEKITQSQPSLFEEYNIPNKRQVFESSLKEKILKKELRKDIDIYLFTLNEGFLIKDANSILKDLNNEGKIDIDFKLTSSDIHKIKTISEIKIK